MQASGFGQPQEHWGVVPGVDSPLFQKRVKEGLGGVSFETPKIGVGVDLFFMYFILPFIIYFYFSCCCSILFGLRRLVCFLRRPFRFLTIFSHKWDFYHVERKWSGTWKAENAFNTKRRKPSLANLIPASFLLHSCFIPASFRFFCKKNKRNFKRFF